MSEIQEEQEKHRKEMIKTGVSAILFTILAGVFYHQSRTAEASGYSQGHADAMSTAL